MTLPLPADASVPAIAVRTRALLEGPITPTLLRLAAPNVAVMTIQALVSTADAYWVGRLGPAALAGVSLVFPFIMLMQTMSSGGMGGGVASAIARALGSGRRDRANALVMHAVVIALVMGLVFTAAVLSIGPLAYRAMGGRAAALESAIAYSTVVFGAATIPWLFNILASVVRGTGNMAVPASAMVVTGLLHLTLTPMLVLGLAGAPRLGIAGAGAAMAIAFMVGSTILATFLLSGRSLVRPDFRELRLRAALFADILRVGAPGSLNTVLTNTTMIVVTGVVGSYGTHALAGYGMGARLEYLLLPIIFGLGSALITMVGTNVGAGQLARAEHIAWVGARLAAAVSGVIGVTVALMPSLWLRMFTADPEVLASGAIYLRIVGPCFAFVGLGLALYCASQGAGRLFWPLVAGFARLVIAAGGGWVMTRFFGGSLAALSTVVAAALVCYGALIAVTMHRGAWRNSKRPA